MIRILVHTRSQKRRLIRPINQLSLPIRSRFSRILIRKKESELPESRFRPISVHFVNTLAKIPIFSGAYLLTVPYFLYFEEDEPKPGLPMPVTIIGECVPTRKGEQTSPGICNFIVI